MEHELFRLEIYVPPEALHAVLEALHAAGAGRVGQYDHVCAYYPVQGRWRAPAGASPYRGAPGQTCAAQEYKVEMRCPAAALATAVAAARRAHPYEEPVIDVFPLLSEI